MTRSKILLVEDEQDVMELMLLLLHREGYEISPAKSGTEAMRLISQSNYDLAVLDWMLPEFSGIQICKSIQSKYPVLMVTARSHPNDIVEGLNAGADDYITKPFDVEIFKARVRTLLRRKKIGFINDQEKAIVIGNLKIDSVKHEATCNGIQLQLTPSEFKLLYTLCKNVGIVMSRDKLINLIQGEGVVVVDRAIDTHVFGLRKKMGECQELIETIRGIGYRVKADK